MGEARLRGSFDYRKKEALTAGRVKVHKPTLSRVINNISDGELSVLSFLAPLLIWKKKKKNKN
jgi:hypothetical protein